MEPFDILVAGEINPDLILTGDVRPEFGQVEQLVESATLQIGSSSVIFACGAARLGLRIVFVGVCGDDIFGRFMLREMQGRGVEVNHVIVREGGQTGLSVILDLGVDRAILTSPGLVGSLRASDIPDGLLPQARHVHVASYFLQTSLRPGLPDLFRHAHELGLTTSLDTNYDPFQTWTGMDELLPMTDVLLPNAKEALSMSRRRDLGLAIDWLGAKVDTLAVKLGAEGALGLRSGHQVKVPSLHVDVVDSVGAGDSFDAGFLYGYLHNWDLERSLQLACACGSLSTRRRGGTEGQPTLDEALTHVS